MLLVLYGVHSGRKKGNAQIACVVRGGGMPRGGGAALKQALFWAVKTFLRCVFAITEIRGILSLFAPVGV